MKVISAYSKIQDVELQKAFKEYVMEAVFVAFVRFKFANDFGNWEEIYLDKESEIV